MVRRSAVKAPYFGELRIESGNYVWEGEALIGDRQVAIHLTCSEGTRLDQLDAVAAIAREPARYDVLARAALAAARDHEDVALYIEHHAAQLARPTVTASELANELVLSSISLYPDDSAGVLDYTLPRDVTQYVLAVSFDRSGQVASIDMES